MNLPAALALAAIAAFAMFVLWAQWRRRGLARVEVQVANGTRFAPGDDIEAMIRVVALRDLSGVRIAAVLQCTGASRHDSDELAHTRSAYEKRLVLAEAVTLPSGQSREWRCTFAVPTRIERPLTITVGDRLPGSENASGEHAFFAPRWAVQGELWLGRDAIRGGQMITVIDARQG